MVLAYSRTLERTGTSVFIFSLCSANDNTILTHLPVYCEDKIEILSTEGLKITRNIREVIGTVLSIFIIVLICIVQDIQGAMCPVNRLGQGGIEEGDIAIDC